MKSTNLTEYLIVGLGNIGNEYDHTRHNIGFTIANQLASQYDIKFYTKKHI